MTPVVAAIIAALEAALPGTEQAVIALVEAQSGNAPTPNQVQALRRVADHAAKLSETR
jgi:hypothetical protein